MVSRLKYELFKKKIKKGVNRVLVAILSKPVKSVYNLNYKIKEKRIDNISIEKAVKITANAIIRKLVKYRENSKTIVIADWASTEHSLERFETWTPIGEFKNDLEESIYSRYIVDNQDNQFKVINALRKYEDIIVEESDYIPYAWEVKGMKAVYKIKLNKE